MKEVIAGDKRYILCFNECQARKDEAVRQPIIESLEEKIANATQWLVCDKGNNRYLKLTRRTIRIDKKKVEADKHFDGKFVSQTNTNLSSPK